MKTGAIKKYLVLSVSLVTLVGSGVYWVSPLSLLSYKDWVLEYESYEHGPELTAALNDPNYWQSFSRWQCFKNKMLTFHCAVSDGKFLIPEVMVEGEDREYVFGLDYAENYDCDHILKAWREVLNSSQKICFFGAYLPTNNNFIEAADPRPTYLISQLKGNVYWYADDAWP